MYEFLLNKVEENCDDTMLGTLHLTLHSISTEQEKIEFLQRALKEMKNAKD